MEARAKGEYDYKEGQMTVKPTPKAEILHRWFEEKEPGILYWKQDHPGGIYKGQLAGWTDRGGYHRIQFGDQYFRHRFIWKMYNGEDPLGSIHHIDGIPGHDWIDNLQDVTDSENVRDGRYYIVPYNNGSKGYDHGGLRLNFQLWSDEDIEAIRLELDNAVSPILDRIIKDRVGRRRPR